MSRRSTLYLPAFVVSAVMLYIFVGSAGNRWADTSLELAFNCAALLHIFCYLLPYLQALAPFSVMLA